MNVPFQPPDAAAAFHAQNDCHEAYMIAADRTLALMGTRRTPLTILSPCAPTLLNASA